MAEGGLADDPGFAGAGPPARVGAVLVVDADPESLALLTALLRDFSVRTARTGSEALQTLSDPAPPDLLILDPALPDMDGFALVARFQGDAAVRDIPVLIVTASKTESDEVRALQLGAADYLTKPVRPRAFAARVRAQLTRRQVRDRLRHQSVSLASEVALSALENGIVEEASTFALAALTVVRDHETSAHLYRTRVYMDLLADSLARSDRHPTLVHRADREAIARAALLHDVGKLCIPDHILLKPSALTPDEVEVMRAHARLGAEAITLAMRKLEASTATQIPPSGLRASLAFLELARQIAASHHERWDGRGYPAGLAGEAIALPARLMSVVDYFDAMTSSRVYHDALPVDAVFDAIHAERGHAFDPEVVDALFAVRDAFARAARRLPESVPP